MATFVSTEEPAPFKPELLKNSTIKNSSAPISNNTKASQSTGRKNNRGCVVGIAGWDWFQEKPGGR